MSVFCRAQSHSVKGCCPHHAPDYCNGGNINEMHKVAAFRDHLILPIEQMVQDLWELQIFRKMLQNTCLALVTGLALEGYEIGL